MIGTLAVAMWCPVLCAVCSGTDRQGGSALLNQASSLGQCHGNCGIRPGAVADHIPGPAVHHVHQSCPPTRMLCSAGPHLTSVAFTGLILTASCLRIVVLLMTSSVSALSGVLTMSGQDACY